MRNLLLLLLLSSCTGGNESIVGKAEFIDYLPSLFMVLGTLISLAGVVTYRRGMDLIDKDESISKTKTGIYITLTGAGIILFGLLTYFN